jgi:cell division septation protein DedD
MDASLKQRLVGAAVLVALAVIFLPMLLKDPAPESGVSGVSLHLPDEPKLQQGVLTQDLPLFGPETSAVDLPAADGPPVRHEDAAELNTPEPAQTPAERVLPADAAGEFAVSFGSYASNADADRVIAVLAQAGLPGYRESVSVAGQQAQRVRIGPFVDRATAESARVRAARVRNDVDVKVLVLEATASEMSSVSKAITTRPVAENQTSVAAAVPPTAPAPAKPEAAVVKPEPAKVEPAKSSVSNEPPPPTKTTVVSSGFVVQIGAFASSKDATALRDSLRKAGFNTFTDTVPSEQGSLTRVRVGPVLTRAEAETLKAQVKTKTGQDGMIRSHP